MCAAAVVLPDDFSSDVLNDSKKLSAKQRNELRTFIEENAESWAVGFVYPERIDEINILNASFEAMHVALDQLPETPDRILVDGNRFIPYKEVDFECIIKGDGKFMAIAAASILAKTYRDEYMLSLHEKWPHYRWDSNKGYPTAVHRAAIKEFGPCEHHRKSFNLLGDKQLLLFKE